MSYRPIHQVLGNRPFPTVAPNNSIRECAFIMKEWKSSAVLVVDGDQLLGIFTERDIVFRCVALSCPLDTIQVAHVMTKGPQHDPRRQAVRPRAAHDVRRRLSAHAGGR